MNLENFDEGKNNYLNIFNDLKTKLKEFENKFITIPEKSIKKNEINEFSLNSLKIFKQINYNEIIYSIKKLNDNRIAFGGKSSAGVRTEPRAGDGSRKIRLFSGF